MKKALCILLIVFAVLAAGCSVAEGAVTTEPEMPRRDAFVNVLWRDFSLTNAEGEQLVMDHSQGNYPDGDMEHGDFGETPGSPASLNFKVPHSERFVFARDGGEFDCSVSTETYGGAAWADEFYSLEVSAGGLVLNGGTTDCMLQLYLRQEGLKYLIVQGHTRQTTAIRQDGNTVTITGLEGEYTLELWKEVGSWQSPIEGTAETGTLTVDLSRVMAENILTIADGDVTGEYAVKEP